MKKEEILNISCEAIRGKWNRKRLKHLLNFIPQKHLDLIYDIKIFDENSDAILGIDKPKLAWVRDIKYIDLNAENLNLPPYINYPRLYGYSVILHELGHIIFGHYNKNNSTKNFNEKYGYIIPHIYLGDDYEVEAECYTQYIIKLCNYRNYFKKFPQEIKNKVILLF